jgi:hypothetical protein
MLTICNINYLSSPEARQFLRMTHRNWQLYRFRIPFIKHEEEDYWKFSELEEIKERMDPEKYIGESQLVIELDTYWLKFRAVVERLNLPRFKHPFHSRMLYRVSDIAFIRRALRAKKQN